MPKEALMRNLALAILAMGLVLVGPAAAQTYDPAFPVCLHVWTRGTTITIAASRRCHSATRRHRHARHSVSSIHISRAGKSPGVTDGIAACTRARSDMGGQGEPVSESFSPGQGTPYAAGNSLGHLSPRAIHKW